MTEVSLLPVYSYEPEVTKCTFNICFIYPSSTHCEMINSGSPYDEGGVHIRLYDRASIHIVDIMLLWHKV